MNRKEQVRMHLAFASAYLHQAKLDRANGREVLAEFCAGERRKHLHALIELRASL